MTATLNGITTVGLGELKVAKEGQGVLSCLGLGSCVGVAAYDPVARVAGMAHIVLPEAAGGHGDQAAKFADTGVPRLFEEMRAHGALTGRLIVKIAGGARMALGAAHDPVFRIGERNIEASVVAIAKQRVRIKARDVGGNRGRTLRLDTDTGRVTVTTAGSNVKEL